MRKIIHLDMDAFFAAVEMRDNPALRNVPMAVGGSSDRRCAAPSAGAGDLFCGAGADQAGRWQPWRVLG